MRKITTLIMIMVLCLAVGCTKEEYKADVPTRDFSTDVKAETASDIHLLLLDHGIRDISILEIERAIVNRSSTITYSGSDLMSFLSEYNTSDIDYIPAWNNFFQDANCNVAQWQYIELNDSIEVSQVQWILNGDTITDNVSLKFETPFNCGGYLPPCNGAHDCTVRVTVNGAIFERSAIGWARVNGLDSPLCQLQVFEVEPSGTFWQGQPLKFEPYEFIVQSSLTWDLNGDYTVNSEDLFIFLANYGVDPFEAEDYTNYKFLEK